MAVKKLLLTAFLLFAAFVPAVAQLVTPLGGTTASQLPTLLARPCTDVANWGANGTAGDGARIQQAINFAASAAGINVVCLHTIGKPYIIDTGLSVPNGVKLLGDEVKNFEGSTATITQWTANGSWLQCTDTVNPCISLNGHGSAVEGLNFIWNQAIPGSGAYTPTTFPYAIRVNGISFITIRDVMLVGCSHGIDTTLNAGSAGGTFSLYENIYESCLTVGGRFQNVNDTINVKNWHSRSVFYSSNTQLVTWMEQNKTGFDIHYLDNAQISDIECLQLRVCMLFTDGTVQGNTHSGYNLQMNKIDCNLVRICMQVAASTTTVTGSIGGLYAQQDTGRNLSDILFQFGSDNVDWNISDLTIPTTGGSIMVLGNGTFGRVMLGSLVAGNNVQGVQSNGWSAVVSGQTGFSISANAQLDVGRRRIFRPNATASFIAGGGVDNAGLPTFTWQPFGSFSQVSFTGTGSAVDITDTNGTRSNNYSFFAQCRLIGQTNVTTPQSGGTIVFSMGNFPTVATSAIPATGSGEQSFDTNWIDIVDTGSAVGRIQQNSTTNVVATLGSLTVLCR